MEFLFSVEVVLGGIYVHPDNDVDADAPAAVHVGVLDGDGVAGVLNQDGTL